MRWEIGKVGGICKKLLAQDGEIGREILDDEYSERLWPECFLELFKWSRIYMPMFQPPDRIYK